MDCFAALAMTAVCEPEGRRPFTRGVVFVIASEAKRSFAKRVAAWIASLRSQ